MFIIWNWNKGRKDTVPFSYQGFLTRVIIKFKSFTDTWPWKGIINIQLLCGQVHEQAFDMHVVVEEWMLYTVLCINKLMRQEGRLRDGSPSLDPGVLATLIWCPLKPKAQFFQGSVSQWHKAKLGNHRTVITATTFPSSAWELDPYPSQTWGPIEDTGPLGRNSPCGSGKQNPFKMPVWVWSGRREGGKGERKRREGTKSLRVLPFTVYSLFSCLSTEPGLIISEWRDEYERVVE